MRIMLKRSRDANRRAFQIVQELTGRRVVEQESPRRSSASKGGHARAAALSPARRTAIARLAAVARWEIRDTFDAEETETGKA